MPADPATGNTGHGGNGAFYNWGYGIDDQVIAGGRELTGATPVRGSGVGGFAGGADGPGAGGDSAGSNATAGSPGAGKNGGAGSDGWNGNDDWDGDGGGGGSGSAAVWHSGGSLGQPGAGAAGGTAGGTAGGDGTDGSVHVTLV